jgi:hypothetical protein
MVTLSLSDGKVTFSLATDEACSAALGKAGRHFVGAVADGGPRIASMMVDGVLCDVSGLSIIDPKHCSAFTCLFCTNSPGTRACILC